MNDIPKAPTFTPAPANATSAFDIAVWQEQILALNSWANGHPLGDGDVGLQAARLDATQDRHAKGKEVWNAWARSMLSLQAELKSAEDWAIGPTGEGENLATRVWLELASAVFSTVDRPREFPVSIDFRDIVFPGNVSFWHANFRGVARFQGVNFRGFARFDEVTFLDDAFFIETIFGATARFTRTQFDGIANFQGAHILGGARFGGATFRKEAHFGRMAIEGSAMFGLARFEGPTSFQGLQVGRRAEFRGVHFTESVDFSQAEFKGTTVFADSFFRRHALFDAVDSQGALTLADSRFRRVPSFIGASFRGLRLDNITTPSIPMLGLTRDKDASARFRELKRRASEAKDHDRELEFFAQEIRTGRFHSKGLPFFVPHAWEWRFWFGLAYGTFSNFGRSLVRPLFFWLTLLLGFAIFYLGQHEDMRSRRAAIAHAGAWDTTIAYGLTTRAAWAAPPACRPANTEEANRLFASTDAVKEALYLSGSNGLVLFNVGRGDVSRRTYGCLYGFEHNGPQAPPIVPYAVAVASTLQTLASAVLIFLFLLAVRNLLRLK